MKKYIFIFALFTFCNISAQKGFETIFLANQDDSKKVLSSFFSPKINGFTNGINNAWFHTAKAHIPFGFDLSVNLINVITPKNKDVFSVSNLTSINAPNGTFNGASSIGSENTTPFSVTTSVNGQNVTASEFFSGGEKGLAIPIVQASFGISNGFDMMIRLAPEMKPNNSNESFSTFGIGLKKEITDWFKLKNTLPLHVSLLAGYTSMNVNYGIQNQELPSGNTSGISAINALSTFKIKSFTFQTIGSLEWNTFSVFGSLGYNTGSADFSTTGILRGQYQGTTSPEVKDLEIPNNLAFTSNSFSATLGSKINLRNFKIYGSFVFQEYNTANIGVAFSVR